MFWAGGTLGGNPRGGIPPGTLGTGTWERGGSMLSNSPSLNVALREIGITFLGFLLLSLPNSPSLNIALWESRFAFFDHINNSWPSKSNLQSEHACGFHNPVSIWI